MAAVTAIAISWAAGLFAQPTTVQSASNDWSEPIAEVVWLLGFPVAHEAGQAQAPALSPCSQPIALFEHLNQS